MGGGGDAERRAQTVRETRELRHIVRTTRAHLVGNLAPCPDRAPTVPPNLGPWPGPPLSMGRKLKAGWSFRPINNGVMGKSRGSVTGSTGWSRWSNWKRRG